MSTGLKANPDGSAAIQVGGTDVITLTSGGAATFVTSPTTVQAGTAAAPSITTSGDTNTGIFFPAADTIAFTEGGVESGRFDSSGRLLVGTSTAITSWGSGAAQQIQATASGVAYPGFSSYSFNNTAGAGGLISLGHSRGATVGTMTATQSGDILGYLIFEGVNSSNALTGGAYIQVSQTAAAGASYIPGSMLFFTSDATNGNTERARITSGGYSKFSNDGTYANATGAYHEFRQTADGNNLVAWSTNGSLTAGIGEFDATRSATSNFTFINCFSNLAGVSDREFQLRGDGNGYADGTWNNNGADYAEFFESATGAALTLGATVVLDGNKVREATDQDPASAIMGVVRPKEPSKASMVVGNTAWNKWANKYLTDDFDRYIMEDHDVLEWIDEEGKQHSYESHNIPASVTVPDDAVVKTHDDKGNKFQHYKLNPAWNPDAEYINRENRPEWIIVGLVGQVKIIKGQPVNDRWIKMRDVSAIVEEWMIR